MNNNIEPEIFPNLSTKQVEVLEDVLHSYSDLHEEAEQDPVFKSMLDEISRKYAENRINQQA